MLPQQQQGTINKARGTILPDDQWHDVDASGEPAFENSWANYGSGYQSARFIKDASGVVHLSGVVASGTVPETIFTLPAGYRPDDNILLSTESNTGIAELEIKPEGDVYVNSGGNTYLSIQVSFYVG